MSDILFLTDLILQRASDPTSGLNPNILTAAAERGIPNPSQLKVDFSGASHQLLKGHIDPAFLDKTTAVKYPQFHVWTETADDQQTNLGGEFSGQVTAKIRIGLSWRKASAQGQDYEVYLRAFVDAMGSTFNRQQHRGWSSPAIAQAFKWTASPAELDGEYWRQWVLYTMPFLIDA